MLRAQQQLAFPLCLSLCELGEEISLVSGDPGLGAVLGGAVCFCFPRRLLGVPDPRLSAGSVVSRAGPGSARAGNVLGATQGWMERTGEAGNSLNSHPPFVEGSSHPLCDCYSIPHGEGQAQP